MYFTEKYLQLNGEELVPIQVNIVTERRIITFITSSIRKLSRFITNPGNANIRMLCLCFAFLIKQNNLRMSCA